MVHIIQLSCLCHCPRPFPPPVFDCFGYLQYANMGGEGLRDLVMYSDRPRIDTDVAVPNKASEWSFLS